MVQSDGGSAGGITAVFQQWYSQMVIHSDGVSWLVVVVRLGVVALWRRLGVVARLQVLSRVAASVSAIHSRTRSSIAAALLARLIVYDCGDI